MKANYTCVAERSDGARLYDHGDGHGHVETEIGKPLMNPDNPLPIDSILVRGHGEWTILKKPSEMKKIVE